VDVYGPSLAREIGAPDVLEQRKKLGDDGPAIETIRGIGYRLVPPPRSTAAAAPPPDLATD